MQQLSVCYNRVLVNWLVILLMSGWVGPIASAQVNLRIVPESDEATYKVYLRASTSYIGRDALISTAQVTLTVPHGAGSNRFEVTNLSSPITAMRWQQNSRVDAPAESPDRDYLFFSFINNMVPTVLFDIPAGQDILLFQFTRKGNCLGSVSLLSNNTDEFRTPNSLGINVGNSVSILGGRGNMYRTNLDAPPSVHIWASTHQLCAGSPLALRADVSVPGSGYLYQWFADGQLIGPSSPAPNLLYSFPNQSASHPVNIRVKLTIPGSTTCQNQFITASDTVLLKSVPEAVIQYTGSTCTQLPTTLSAQLVAGASYQWLADTTAVTKGTQADYLVERSGTFSVRITANGCWATSKPLTLVGVSQAERITVRIGPGTTVVAGNPVGFNPAVTNAASFTWSPAEGLSSASIRNPVASPSTTTTYTLTVQSASGCPASDTVTIRVVPGLYLPTAFTPNDDGVNDTWVIRNAEYHTPCQISVFNRWGNLVYHTDAYQNPWNARVNGEPVESGDYTYQIRTPVWSYQGMLSIVR